MTCSDGTQGDEPNGEGSDWLELLIESIIGVAVVALAVYLYLLRRIFLSTADQLCIGMLYWLHCCSRF